MSLLGPLTVKQSHTSSNKSILSNPSERLYQLGAKQSNKGAYGTTPIQTTTKLVVCHPGKSGQELKAGTWRQKPDAEAMEGRYLPAWSVVWICELAHDLLSLLSYSNQDHQTRHETALSELGLSHPSLIRKMSHRLTHNTSYWQAFSQLSLLLPNDSLAYWKPSSAVCYPRVHFHRPQHWGS